MASANANAILIATVALDARLYPRQHERQRQYQRRHQERQRQPALRALSPRPPLLPLPAPRLQPQLRPPRP
eukprot:13677957-Alexandrium_andersonii.AAC.1